MFNRVVLLKTSAIFLRSICQRTQQFSILGHSHSPDPDCADHVHSHPDDARRGHRRLLQVLLRRPQQDRVHGTPLRRVRGTPRRGLRPAEPESQVTVHLYRVTIPLVQNLPLTSKQKFRFGLARPGQARPKRNFCFKVNGRFVTS